MYRRLKMSVRKVKKNDARRDNKPVYTDLFHQKSSASSICYVNSTRFDLDSTPSSREPEVSVWFKSVYVARFCLARASAIFHFPGTNCIKKIYLILKESLI